VLKVERAKLGGLGVRERKKNVVQLGVSADEGKKGREGKHLIFFRKRIVEGSGPI